jgi:hypothetical protein
MSSCSDHRGSPCHNHNHSGNHDNPCNSIITVTPEISVAADTQGGEQHQHHGHHGEQTVPDDDRDRDVPLGWLGLSRSGAGHTGADGDRPALVGRDPTDQHDEAQ